MCTAMTFRTKDFYFGRNMDIEYHFGERVVLTPRNLALPFRAHEELKHHFAILGMGSIEGEYPLYADAMNEKGLVMAGLNFPGNACYHPRREDKKYQITPYELIPWILGLCASVAEARALLEQVNLINIPFSEKLPLAPLHWIVADRESAIVAEPMEDGLKIYDNPVGVLTNNPPFWFHMTNLNQYMSLSAQSPENRFGEDLPLRPFGQGFGGLGLPGDASPASRFIRTAFLKWKSSCEQDEENSVSQVFHIMGRAAMVRGEVKTSKGLDDYTTYSACMNADRGIYYYRTYENDRITAVHMHRENLEHERLITYELNRQLSFAEETPVTSI